MSSSLWWLTLGVLLAAAVAFRQDALAVFVFVLALASAASELWARFCLSSVTYRRRLADHQIAYGEETTLALEFINAKPLPLAWLLVRDRFPERVNLLTAESRTHVLYHRHTLVSLLSLRWYERVARTHRLRGEHRGHFEFGPAELTSGDVFGFRRRRRVEETMDTLIVYPKVVPVDLLGLPADRPIGEWLARRRIIEDPLRFAMVREYAPGDSPRYIHWKATARTGALQTKVFDPSDTLALMLAVDVQTMPMSYDHIPEYLEYIISAAASLAVRALDERHMVGLCANVIGRHTDTWVRIPPGRHPQQAPEILATLSGLGPFRRLPFEEMIYTVQQSLPFGSTVIALTSSPHDALYETLLAVAEAGHPALLLTVGDTRPDVPETLTHYHLGGRDAWRNLEALELG